MEVGLHRDHDSLELPVRCAQQQFLACRLTFLQMAALELTMRVRSASVNWQHKRTGNCLQVQAQTRSGWARATGTWCTMTDNAWRCETATLEELQTACTPVMSTVASTQGALSCSGQIRSLFLPLQGSAPDDLCAVVYDVAARKRARVLPRPVFTVSPDGALATSVDFIRLQKVRKGAWHVG